MPRPFDPDDLPLEVTQTPEERSWIASLPPRAFTPGGGLALGDGSSATSASGHGELAGRPFRLKMLAGKFLGSGSKSA